MDAVFQPEAAQGSSKLQQLQVQPLLNKLRIRMMKAVSSEGFEEQLERLHEIQSYIPQDI